MEPDLRAPRLLLVEEDPEMRVVLGTYLEGQGFRVDPAGSVAEALGRLRRAEAADLVLVDLRFPHVEAVDMIQGIRGSPAWREAPVLMAASDARERSLLESEPPLADAYLLKPIDLGDLAGRCRVLLELRGGRP